MDQSEVGFFDRIAKTWDENEVRSIPERIDSILSKLPLARGMHVLDLGTGTGVLIPYLSRIVGNSGHITAVDFSEGMLSRARQKYGNLENVDFLKLDFENERINGLYDIALLYSVYPHLHYPELTIKTLFNTTLKDDGDIIIAFPSDEKFINDIHRRNKSESDPLPSAGDLAEIIRTWGFDTSVLAADTDEYIILVRRQY